MEEGSGGIGSEHEVLADEEGVEADGAKILKISVSAQAGFGNGEAVIGNMLDQVVGSLHADIECFEVAVVDADDAGIGGESAIEFGAGVDFDERFHSEFAAESEKIAEKRIVEDGDNQKETVGVVGARLPDLPGVEDEILTKGGKRDSFAGIPKIFQRAAKEFAFGEDRKGGSASGLERFGKFRGIEGIANDAAGRRGRLEFGDDVESIAGECGQEIADGGRSFHAISESGFGEDALAVVNLGATRIEDAVEDCAGVGGSVHRGELVS